jgi:thiamine-phosphate pyrophosphorylase
VTDDTARLYLITPASFGIADFTERLAAVLDGFEIACVRMALATTSEDDLARASDALRAVCDPRDVPLVVNDHFRLVERLGLDGVHLTDGARQVRSARKLLGPDAIVGAFARTSRHDGMNAGEIGADYVSFGPLSSSAMGDGAHAPVDLFEWWSQLIEIPVVAEGGVTARIARELSGVTDFVAVGDEAWSHADGEAAALREIMEALS